MKGKSYKAAMYGLWKSDNNIVPEKPANKKAESFAELVEGRVLTEWNTLTKYLGISFLTPQACFALVATR